MFLSKDTSSLSLAKQAQLNQIFTSLLLSCSGTNVMQEKKKHSPIIKEYEVRKKDNRITQLNSQFHSKATKECCTAVD